MSKAHSQRVSSEQRGIALISVLLVVAVLVAITTRLLEDHNLVVHHHRATFEQNQALQYAYGAETLARQVLFQDYANTDPKIDHLAEPWAKQLAPFELDDIGYMETQLRDLNGCFNLNAFASNDEVILKRALKRLKRMLRELQIDESLADNVRDWIDADGKVQGFGAEDNNYLVRCLLIEPLTEEWRMSQNFICWILPIQTKSKNYYLLFVYCPMQITR